MPARPLFWAPDPGGLHQKTGVKDGKGQTLCYAWSSVTAITGKTEVSDASGKRAARLSNRPAGLRGEHCYTMEDGQKFKL